MKLMKSLADKIKDPTRACMFYELLPPAYDKGSNLEAYIDCAIDLLTSSTMVIDAINIPEIRDEHHNNKERSQTYIPKLDPGFFAELVAQAAYKNIEMVLNHCTVYEPWSEQKKWLKASIEEHNL